MNDFDDFNALVSRWTGAYVCAVHSYVGLKTPEGHRLLCGRVLFETTRSGTDETPFKFETEHIFAGRFVKAAGSDDVCAAVAKAKVGEMDRFDDVISLADDSGRFSSYLAPLHHQFISSLSIRGESQHKLLNTPGFPRNLDWQLKAADAPFDTLDELLGLCGLPASTQMGDSTILEIVVASPGAIDGSSSIKDGEAVIDLRVSKALNLAKLRLGYRIFRKAQGVHRASVAGDVLQWREENDLRVGVYRVSMGEAPVLHAYLSHDGIPLDQSSITDPKKRLNPRHAIHQIFDADLELLRLMLLGPEKSQEFEGAVSTLLTLLGFSAANYGRIPKLQEGPDIVAVTPSGHVGIFECTIGLLNQNHKLAKLVQRTNLIKEKLAEAGYSYLQLQPVIVTSLSREEVAADIADAEEHGIAVVCRGDLEDLLNRVALTPNADRIFQDVKKLVPVSGLAAMFHT